MGADGKVSITPNAGLPAWSFCRSVLVRISGLTWNVEEWKDDPQAAPGKISFYSTFHIPRSSFGLLVAAVMNATVGHARHRLRDAQIDHHRAGLRVEFLRGLGQLID